MTIKKKISIVFIIVAALSAGITYFVILPTIKDIREMNEIIIIEKKDLELKYQKGQLIKKINENFKKIKPDKEKLYSMFVPLGRELEFIENLETIKQNYDITQQIELLNSDNEDSPENQLKKVLPLRVTLSGDFTQVLKYLNKLEKLNYYFNVHNIIMETKSSELGTVNAFLEGKTFSLQSL